MESTVTSTWYARIQTTVDEIHLYELAPAVTEEEMEARTRRIEELRIAHGIPEDWVAGYPPPAQYDVSILEGPLHPKLVAIATLHPLDPDGTEPGSPGEDPPADPPVEDPPGEDPPVTEPTDPGEASR